MTKPSSTNSNPTGQPAAKSSGASKASASKADLIFGADTMTRKQVLDAITKGTPLHSADLRGLDLSGLSFNDIDLHDAKLADTNLSRCSFRNADLTGASLWAANLRDAILDGSNLENADLDFANLDGASIKGAKIKKTIFPSKGIGHDQIRDAVKTGKRLRVDTNAQSDD